MALCFFSDVESTDSPIRRFSNRRQGCLSHIFVSSVLCVPWSAMRFYVGLGRESMYYNYCNSLEGKGSWRTDTWNRGVCNLFTMGINEATMKFLITPLLDWFHWVFVHQM